MFKFESLLTFFRRISQATKLTTNVTSLSSLRLIQFSCFASIDLGLETAYTTETVFWKRPNPVYYNSVCTVSFQLAKLVTLTDLPTKNVFAFAFGTL